MTQQEITMTLSDMDTSVSKLRAAIYIRYSSENQRDGYSVEYQLDECKKYIDEQDYLLINSYVDEATTGKTTNNRSAFFELLNDVKKGMYDVVIVYKYSRFARNLVEASLYRQQIEKQGVKLISAMERIDDSTPEGRMMRNIIMVMDEYYSDNLSTFVQSSMYTAAKNGKFLGGQAPFGYMINDEGTYSINVKEAEIVKSIFDLYVNSFTMSDILRWLDAQGYRTRKGNNFSVSGIYTILHNAKYIGRYEYQVEGYDTVIIDDAFTPIIDIDVWHRAQLRNDNATDKFSTKGRVRKRTYPLTGKITCGCCGDQFVGNAKTHNDKKTGERKEYNYYTCRGKKHKRVCKNKDIRKDLLENYVFSEIKKNMLNAEDIEKISERVYSLVAEDNTDLTSEIKALKKEKSQLEKKQEALVDLLLDGDISKSVLNKKSAKLKERLAAVEKQLDMKQIAASTAISIDMVKGYLTQLLNDLESGDDALKKAAVDQVVKEIIVAEDDVTVTLGVNYNYFFRDKHHCGGGLCHLSLKRKELKRYK